MGKFEAVYASCEYGTRKHTASPGHVAYPRPLLRFRSFLGLDLVRSGRPLAWSSHVTDCCARGRPSTTRWSGVLCRPLLRGFVMIPFRTAISGTGGRLLVLPRKCRTWLAARPSECGNKLSVTPFGEILTSSQEPPSH